MRHSAIRQKNETVSLFAKTNNTSEDCIVSKILSDGTFSSVSYTPNIISVDTNMFSTDIQLPDEDCTLFILFKGQPIVIIVGSPEKFFIYYRIETGQSVLYEHIYDNGDNISQGLLAELSNGFYALKINDYPDSIVIVDDKPYPVRLPYENIVYDMSGTIKIQNNVWQLISIPVSGEKVKEYFVDRLASKYSVAPEDMIEICTAYFGDENRFRSYIPGVTNPSTSNNFPLVYDDSNSSEISGFWVKIKDLTGLVSNVDNVIFDWGGAL